MQGQWDLPGTTLYCHRKTMLSGPATCRVRFRGVRHATEGLVGAEAACARPLRAVAIPSVTFACCIDVRGASHPRPCAFPHVAFPTGSAFCYRRLSSQPHSRFASAFRCSRNTPTRQKTVVLSHRERNTRPKDQTHNHRRTQMRPNVIFFGWNRPIPGRERMSAEHFQQFGNTCRACNSKAPSSHLMPCSSTRTAAI